MHRRYRAGRELSTLSGKFVFTTVIELTTDVIEREGSWTPASAMPSWR